MKSKIRKQIEKILGGAFRLGYVDATSKTKTKFRMKLVTSKVPTEIQLQKIKALPNVIDAKYHTTRSRFSYYDGVAIYFSCKPSSIVIS